jgi:hypothetical protein
MPDEIETPSAIVGVHLDFKPAFGRLQCAQIRGLTFLTPALVPAQSHYLSTDTL